MTWESSNSCCPGTAIRQVRRGASTTVGGTAPAATRTVDGNVHLTDCTDNDGPTSTVILTGAIGDYGTARTINADGSVETKRPHQLSLMLTHGSFRLGIAKLEEKFAATMANLPVNTTTCSASATATQPVPVVAGSGTGSYKGISGTFTLTVTLDEVYRPTGCSETSPYLAQAIVITGPGTDSVG